MGGPDKPGCIPLAGQGLTRARDRIRSRPDYRRLVLITALFGTAAGSYPVTVLSASLPRIARDLGTADDTVTWVIAAPLLAFAAVSYTHLTLPTKA